MSPITAGTNSDANPYLTSVNDICAVCFLQLDEHVPTFPMSKLLPTKEPIQAHRVLESISRFALASDGPQYLCFECFHKTKTIYEFQQMCNKAQHYYEDYKNKLTLIKAEIEQLVVTTPAIAAKTFDNKKRGRPSTKVVEQNFYNEEDELINLKQSTNKQNSKFYGKTYTTYTKASSSRVQNELQTVERPFKCFLCEKSFSTKEVLNVHMIGHKDDKPISNVIPSHFVAKPARKGNSKYKAVSKDNQDKIDLDDAPSMNLAAPTPSDLYNKLKRVRRKRKHRSSAQADDDDDDVVVVLDGDEQASEVVLIKGEPQDNGASDATPKKGRPRKAAKQLARPYGCNACDDDEKPIVCEICAKAFKRREALLLHQRRHDDRFDGGCFEFVAL